MISPLKLYDLNRAFGATGVSPLMERDKDRLGVLSAKFRRSTDEIIKMAEDAKKTPTSVLETLRECKDCDALAACMRTKLEDLSDCKLHYMLLTSAPLKLSAFQLMNAVNCTPQEAEQAIRLRKNVGVCSHPDWKPTRPALSQNVKENVRDFYLSSENGKISADPDDTV